MARIEEMTGVGVQPEQARVIAGTVDTDVTATGDSSQDDSYLISAALTYVTGGGATTGVRLPADAQVSDSFTIGNGSGSNLLVYPPTGGAINGGSANAAKTVSNGKGILIKRVDATNWIAVVE